MHRRQFLLTASAMAAPLAFGKAKITLKERVDKALAGAEVDRPPFTFWHHFNLKTPEDHARATLAFHKLHRTDIVKVMSDFPYPRPAGPWYELKPESNPFAPQIRALDLIRGGLDGRAYFIETIFNPFNVAEKLSSKEEVRRLKDENPQALLTALDVITQSEINHARRALKAGASGIFLAIANANEKQLSREDYIKFSLPFDRRVVEAVGGAKLNFVHLHVDPSYLDLFLDFPPAVFNYSAHVSGIPIADVRRKFRGVIAGGIDERKYLELAPEDLRAQWEAAAGAAGPKFILTPGCSVPNESKPEELSRLPNLLGA